MCEDDFEVMILVKWVVGLCSREWWRRRLWCL